MLSSLILASLVVKKIDGFALDKAQLKSSLNIIMAKVFGTKFSNFNVVNTTFNFIYIFP